MNILQISDIHLKSKYDDQFPAEQHLNAIIQATKDQCFDAVVLTGDLVDDSEDGSMAGRYGDYAGLFITLRNAYGEDTPLLVTPGNHDVRSDLEEAYNDFCRGKSWETSGRFSKVGSFNNPGESLIVLKIPNYYRSIILMDTGHQEFPYESMCRVAAHMQHPEHQRYMLFTHMPIIRPFHLFMNDPKFTIGDDDNVFLSMLATTGCDAILCGHYHSESHMMAFGIHQYAAPASQVQIDPYTKTCNPSGNFPGYAVIKDNGQFEYSTHYIINKDAK